MSKINEYRMSISLNVLKHLGIGLYSNVPAVLAEAVANAWDADASKVDIDIDLSKGRISISDNGHGMSKKDINEKYLTVGYERRAKDEERTTPKYKRSVMGRKGIGKLSLFSIANTIEIHTVKNAQKNGFRMIVEEIKKCAAKKEEYFPLPIKSDLIEVDKGTKLVITDLNKNLSQTPKSLKKRLARRFSIIGSQMNFNIKINGGPVTVEDRNYYHKIQYLWWYGNESQEYLGLCKKLETNEMRANKISIKEDVNGEVVKVENKIKGWIGSVKESGSLKDEDDNLNKIVLLVRGKLAQEDILEDFTEGGLYSKYLIGEINADFFDLDDKEDSATSSRQEMKRDDPRYIALKEFIGKELKFMQNKWTALRNESGTEEAKKIPEIEEWFKALNPNNRKKAQRLFGKINQLTVDSVEEKKRLFKHSILAFESLKYKENLEALESISAENLSAFSEIFISLDDIEATLYYQIVKERIQVIEALRKKVEGDALEKVIHKHLFDHLWLLDPSWERATETPYMEESVTKEFEKINAKLSKKEKAGRLDIKYKTTSGKHIIIELKRASRVVSSTEIIDQISKYRSALQKLLEKAGQGNQQIEVVCVVGQNLKDWKEPKGGEESGKMLVAKGTRVILYNELIQNAYKAYKAFVEKKAEASRLFNLIQSIDTGDILD